MQSLDPQASGCRGSRTFQGSLHQAFQFPDRGLLPACVSRSPRPHQARSNVSQVSELGASSSSHLAPSLLSKTYHPSRLGPHSPSFGSSQTTCHHGPSLPKLLPMPPLQLVSSRERSIPRPQPLTGRQISQQITLRPRTCPSIPTPLPTSSAFLSLCSSPGPPCCRQTGPGRHSQPLSPRHGLAEDRWPRRCWTCTKSTPSSPKPGCGLVPPSQRTAGLRESVGHRGPHLGPTAPPNHSKIPVPPFPFCLPSSPCSPPPPVHTSQPPALYPAAPCGPPKHSHTCLPPFSRATTSWVSLHPVHTQKRPGATTRIFRPWPLLSAHFDSPVLSGQVPGLQIPASTSNPQPHPGHP